MDTGERDSKESTLPVAQVVRNKSIRLLVVEDDKFLRNLIVKKLHTEGFEVTEAEDGESGLEAMQEQRPQLVLLDIVLPGMSGFEVLTRIQATPALKGIPVMVLSNLGQREDKERARMLGAKDFLIKAQFTPGEIVQHVKDILKDTYL